MALFGPPSVAKLAAKKDVPGLLSVLANQKDVQIRWDAIMALGQIGDPRAVDPIILALRDSRLSIRSAAKSALTKIGAPAVDSLIALLPSWDAAEVLGDIGDRRAVKPLLAVLPNWAAINALGRLGDPAAVKPLLAILVSPDLLDRAAAARALGRIGDPRALEPIRAMIGDSDQNVREAVEGALELLGRPKTSSPAPDRPPAASAPPRLD